MAHKPHHDQSYTLGHACRHVPAAGRPVRVALLLGARHQLLVTAQVQVPAVIAVAAAYIHTQRQRSLSKAVVAVTAASARAHTHTHTHTHRQRASGQATAPLRVLCVHLRGALTGRCNLTARGDHVWDGSTSTREPDLRARGLDLRARPEGHPFACRCSGAKGSCSCGANSGPLSRSFPLEPHTTDLPLT